MRLRRWKTEILLDTWPPRGERLICLEGFRSYPTERRAAMLVAGATHPVRITTSHWSNGQWNVVRNW